MVDMLSWQAPFWSWDAYSLLLSRGNAVMMRSSYRPDEECWAAQGSFESNSRTVNAVPERPPHAFP